MKKLFTILFAVLSLTAIAQTSTTGGIQAATNFKIGYPAPADDRQAVANVSDLNGVHDKYNGLRTKVASTGDWYEYNGTTWVLSNGGAGATNIVATHAPNGVLLSSSTGNGSTIVAGTSANMGVTKLYGSTGTNTDGTITQNGINTLLAGKLNTMANSSLAGSDVQVATLNPNGSFTRSDITYNPQTRTLYIGSGANSGKIDIASSVFKLKVQPNITSGNASIEFNNNQENALYFTDTSGTVYMVFKSTTNSKGVLMIQDLVFDQRIFAPVTSLQAAITTNGAGVKVYGKDSLGVDKLIDLLVDGETIVFTIDFIVKNATASQVICGRKKVMAKRVDGLISLTEQPTEIISNHSNTTNQTWQVGVDNIANRGLKFYFTPGASDNTAYSGAFTEIKYSKT